MITTLMLSYVLIGNLRHRRRLIRLASEDSLTAATAYVRDHRSRSFQNDQRPLRSCGWRLRTQGIRACQPRLLARHGRSRWGGEEFLLILPDTTLDSALASVERLRTLALEIQVPSADERTPIRVTFSAGLATTADGARCVDEIIARADAALYEAKNDGRDMVRIDRESYQSAPTGVRRTLKLR
jgi:predicted signal transduction protein with EAL and GGDEF domain